MYKRGKVFLNNSIHEGGSIMWEVGNEGWRYDREPASDEVHASISISDCSYTINLDLDCKYPNTIDNRISKVDILIKELTKCKETLVDIKKSREIKRKFIY